MFPYAFAGVHGTAPALQCVFQKAQWATVIMESPMSGFGSLESGTPLPPVNADDLKRVCYMVQQVTMGKPAEVGAQSVGINAELIAEQCGAGADVFAIFVRAALIQYLFGAGLLDKWREGNGPSDPVFQVGAAYSLEQGVQGFDPAAFMERLRALPLV